MGTTVFGDEAVTPDVPAAGVTAFGDPVVKPAMNPVNEAAAHARDIVSGNAPNPYQEKPSPWEQASFGLHKVVSGAQNLAYLIPTPEHVAAEYIKRAVMPHYAQAQDEANEAAYQQRIKENQDTQAAMDKGRGITPASPWYKKIAPWEVAGEAVGTGPLADIVGPGAGVAKAVTTGALQGGIQGGITGAATGNAASGAASGVLAGGTLGGLLHSGAKAFTDYVASKLPDALQNEAVRKIMERMGQDEQAGGVTAKQALDAINAARAQGLPMTLADTGGKNVQGLAGYVARRPGESKEIASQFLTGRDQSAPIRLNSATDQYINGGDSMHDTMQALLAARSAAARPAYETAMDPTRVVDSPGIRQIINDPTVKGLMNRGIESQRLEALANGTEFKPYNQVTESTTGKARSDALMNPVHDKNLPNMRLLDAAKRGLDSEIEGERDTLTGRLSQRGVMLDRVRQKLVDELDANNPDYAAARASWGGPSASMDAMRFGQTAFNRPPAETAAQLAKMTDSEREFARVGLADKIREKIAKTGFQGDEAKALVNNDWVKQQLRPFFKSDDEASKFLQSVDAERQMKDSMSRMLAGSQTAERQAEDKGNDALRGTASGLSGLLKLKAGHLLGAWRDFSQMARLHGLQENTELNAEIARRLFDPDLHVLEAPAIRVGGVDTAQVPAIAGRVASVAIPPTVGAVSQPGPQPQPVQ